MSRNPKPSDIRARLLESLESMKITEKRSAELFALSLLTELVKAVTKNALNTAVQRALQSEAVNRLTKR